MTIPGRALTAATTASVQGQRGGGVPRPALLPPFLIIIAHSYSDDRINQTSAIVLGDIHRDKERFKDSLWDFDHPRSLAMGLTNSMQTGTVFVEARNEVRRQDWLRRTHHSSK